MSAIISSKQHILEASRTFGSDLELQALQCETDPCKQAFPFFYFSFFCKAFSASTLAFPNSEYEEFYLFQRKSKSTQNTKNSNFFKEYQNR